jgi:ABC-2 type transport system ATP-binding protein
MSDTRDQIEAEAATPAVDVRNLRKSFKLGFARRRTFQALDGVSLSIKPRSIAGFLGPNGAGKTTTIKILTGLIFADSGEARILGELPTSAQARRRLGYLPENPSFHDHLTGREALGVACELAGMSGRDGKRRIGEALEMVKLSHAADLQVRRYSKGMTQRLGIAQALVHDPELLILDEPMSGLDPVGRRDIKDLLRALAGRGKTLFFSTHIIADVEDICDRVTMVVGGKIVRDASVHELLGDESGEMEIVASNVPESLASRAASTSTSGLRTFLATDANAARRLVEELWQGGARVMSMNLKRHRLEDYFMREVQKQPPRARMEV